MDAVKDQLNASREKLDQIPILQKAEEATKIPKEIIVVVGLVLVVAVVFFGIGAGSLCSIAGFLYPAFKSFEAIESKVRGDDTQWLIYWVVYAFFNMIEVFADFLLYWIPFYYAFKLAFLLWAMLPQTQGAKFLYDSFLKDLLKKHESKIDAALDEAKRSFNSATAELSSVAVSAAAESAETTEKTENEKKAE